MEESMSRRTPKRSQIDRRTLFSYGAAGAAAMAIARVAGSPVPPAVHRRLTGADRHAPRAGLGSDHTGVDTHAAPIPSLATSRPLAIP